MSDDHHLVHLDDLLVEEVDGLQVRLLADLPILTVVLVQASVECQNHDPIISIDFLRQLLVPLRPQQVRNYTHRVFQELARSRSILSVAGEIDNKGECLLFVCAHAVAMSPKWYVEFIDSDRYTASLVSTDCRPTARGSLLVHPQMEQSYEV